MEQKRHILITGYRRAGKSTLIRRLLDLHVGPVYGFVTAVRPPAADGRHPSYIHPAHEKPEERHYGEDNLVGWGDKAGFYPTPEPFATLGAPWIAAAKPGGILLMDELGVFEARMTAFTDAVFRALDGDIPVIAAVKVKEGIPFLDQVRAHPNATLYTITPENREELYLELSEIVKGWGNA